MKCFIKNSKEGEDLERIGFFKRPNDSGFTKTPNEFFDEVVINAKSLNEVRVVAAVIRKTRGWQKKFDGITRQDFINSGISNGQLSNAIRSCIQKNWILVYSATPQQKYYFLNDILNCFLVKGLKEKKYNIRELEYLNDQGLKALVIKNYPEYENSTSTETVEATYTESVEVTPTGTVEVDRNASQVAQGLPDSLKKDSKERFKESNIYYSFIHSNNDIERIENETGKDEGRKGDIYPFDQDLYNKTLEQIQFSSFEEKDKSKIDAALQYLLMGKSRFPASIITKQLYYLDYFAVERAVNNFKRAKGIKSHIAYLASCLYWAAAENNAEVDNFVENIFDNEQEITHHVNLNDLIE